jgi:hypothetical protein
MQDLYRMSSIHISTGQLLGRLFRKNVVIDKEGREDETLDCHDRS